MINSTPRQCQIRRNEQLTTQPSKLSSFASSRRDAAYSIQFFILRNPYSSTNTTHVYFFYHLTKKVDFSSIF